MISIFDFFTDHTFKTVLLGTTVIGIFAGALGCFAYLKQQSLVSDVISHAALPGTLIGFLFAVFLYLDGRNTLILLTFSIILATLAVILANWISNTSKIKIDTAMAICLTLFFSLGLILMRIISNGAYRGKGGIQNYLLGNASTITRFDLQVSTIIGILVLVVVIIFFKELKLILFDPTQAKVLGFGNRFLEILLFTIIVIATTLGIKTVGVVLMVAFVITPPAAARQWTNSLASMMLISALIGGLASAIGAYLSIAFGNLPTGPVIVLTLFAFFLFSLLFAPRRSLIAKALNQIHKSRALRNSIKKGAVNR